MACPPIDGGEGGLTDGHKQIDREITKLKEDSATDVQKQLEQQRSAAREGGVEEVCLRVCRSAVFWLMLTVFRALICETEC